MNFSREGSGQDDGNHSADDGSDNKNLELIQFAGLSAVFFRANTVLKKLIIISAGNNRQCQVFS
jgi:hypothetical protein